MRPRRERRQLPPFVYQEPPALARRLEERKRAAEREMWAFDNLPPAIRAAAVRSPLPPNAEILREKIEDLRYRLRLPAVVLAEAVAAEMPLVAQAQIAEFGRRYRERHGTDLPHVAAGVPPLS